MFNGATAHLSKTIALARAWSSVGGTHHVSSCLDQAHMGLLCSTIVSCIYFFFNKHCYSTFPSPSLHVCLCVRVGVLPICHTCSLSLLHGDLTDTLLCGFCVLSQIFWPNQSLELRTEYQKQSIGTVSGYQALNLSWDDIFWSQIYKICFLGFTNENTS
jgi:hypothetical protein